jgi:hypothetical protein
MADGDHGMTETFDPDELTAAQIDLRDRFAMAALTGMIANPGTRGDADDLADYLAGESYRYADAMMKARKQ